MTHELIRFDPDEIGPGEFAGDLPAWAVELLSRAREAAASGQTVTLSAEERLLSPEQVAQRMSMHRSTVVRKILAGEVRAVKVGTHHRIPYSEFLRFRETTLDQVARASAADIEAELFGEG